MRVREIGRQRDREDREREDRQREDRRRERSDPKKGGKSKIERRQRMEKRELGETEKV